MTMLAIKMVDGYPQLPRFNASEVLFANLTLNEDKYKTYGPMLMSPWWAIGYGTSFGALTATISHVSLFHGKEIWMTFRNVMSQRRGGPNLVKEDIHTKLMNAYPEVVKCVGWG